MDMNKGRITPVGSASGHSHPITDIFSSEHLMRVPSTYVQGLISSSSTAEDLVSALEQWISEQ